MSRRTLTDISCQIAQVRDKAIAVVDGTMEGKREKWFWLPLSRIEVDPSEYDVGDTVIVTLPESLAIEKELL